MPNRLADEQSPYLRHNKDNPVDWYPWGEEAFEKAKAEDKPIFLSIGYSTCHWCHVMAHESFEDEEVAEMMNEAFVSIKADREEFRSEFMETNRSTVNVCPGVSMHYRWSRSRGPRSRRSRSSHGRD